MIQNTDIYQDDDEPMNLDSSMDKLSHNEEQQLQISLNTGGKKQATFLEKLAKT